MAQAETSTRSYRCTYFPKDKQGVPQPCDSGALPSIQVRAANANAAELLAGATVNGLVAHVERIDDDAADLRFTTDEAAA